jgi:hypothetical protein
MKQLMVMMLALGVAMTAGAQGKIRTGRISPVSPRPKVIVVAPSFGYGYGYRYSPFYNPYTSFYSPFNDPFYRGRVVERVPSDLQLQVEDIDNDFSYQISTVRHDKTLEGKDRRQKIRDLKHQKENAIINAKRAYWNAQREKTDTDK